MLIRDLIEAPVASSWITDVTLMTDSSGSIVFATSTGSRYRVEGAGQELYQQWIAAPSKGQFFHQQVEDQFTVIKLI